jgi:HSP20 family protein
MVYPTLFRRGTTSLWDDIYNMRREFDRFLEGGLGAGELTSAWVPPVDVRETGDEIAVELELPGLGPEEVDVRVESGVLTVSGEKKSEVEEGKEGSGYHLIERRYGRFERSFTLPRSVNANKVEARFTNGVLSIRLPKAEAAKPRRIEIQGGNAQQLSQK